MSGPLPRPGPRNTPRPGVRGRARRKTALVLGLIGLACAGPSSPILAKGAPPSPPQRLEAIERQRGAAHARAATLARQAEALARQAEDIARKLVVVAHDARGHEQAIADLRRRLAQIGAERKRRTAGLQTKRARLAQLLAALQRIARHPPEALMAYTHTPQDTLRGAMLLRAAIPKLDAEARALRIELETLARLAEQAAARREALARERAGLKSKRRQLAALVAKKRGLARTTRAEQKKADARARALARQAKNLRELLAGIERDRKKRVRARRGRPPAQKSVRLVRPPTHKPAPKRGPKDGAGAIRWARGQLAQPVIGRVATTFGARANGAAVAAKGVRFATRPGAQVVAPFGGEVMFSGPFRGYGPLLIIDHGGGYHSLLAGLGRIDATVGHKLLAGEPVGVMPRMAKGYPRLYMELRRGGRPIDPLPWLAAPPNSKVNG